MKQCRIVHKPCGTKRFTIWWEQGDKQLRVTCPKCRQTIAMIDRWAPLEPAHQVIEQSERSPIIGPPQLIIPS